MSRRERTQVVLQAIRELSSDPSLYARGRWQRARMEIAELIEQHTRVQISPHAVSKYQKLAGYPSLKDTTACFALGECFAL
jgi:hypothetical protein